jgi:hypothetical protein
MLELLERMRFRLGSCILIVSIISGCTLPSQSHQRFVFPALQPSDLITALAAQDQRQVLVGRRASGRCELLVLNLEDKRTEVLRALSFCPERITIGTDQSLLLFNESESLLLDPEGRPLWADGRIVGAITADNLLIERAGRLWWKKGERVLGLDADLRHPRILPRSDAVLGIATTKDGESLLRIGTADTRTLTPSFRAIDSFDVSPDEKEIVLSADAGNGFDVALVSAEGDSPRWIFPDQLPERMVSWAPRGNKVSYVIETDEGSILRTVHVPTAFSLAVDFPLKRVEQVSWEPKAEKLAVLVSSFDRGSAIEWLRYGGEDREVVLSTSGGEGNGVDRVGGALVQPPEVTRYGQRYPLVVWVEPGDALRWKAIRQTVRKLETGTAVVSPWSVGPDLWKALLGLPWVDKERLIVVYNQPPPAEFTMPSGITVVVPSPQLKDRYRVVRGAHTTVTVPLRPPEEIEAFAAGWIEHLLKGSRR